MARKRETTEDGKIIIRRKKKKDNKSIVILSLLAVFVVSIFAWSASLDEGDGNDNTAHPPTVSEQAEPEQEPETEPEKDYIKKLEWADFSSLLVAVEVDDYDGDIIKAGTWELEETSISNLGKGCVPIIWDIYVFDGDPYENGRVDLDNGKQVCSVGGWDAEDKVWKADFEAGQYVAIVYTNMAGKPCGIFEMRYKE